ncbi:hypothetical protein ACGFS9_30235 [Streptomyces sp. NPDC048566]|uniref:hypothetical protein n=1 Tax=Streptomyces sp. NPDC048566 TaxID=3365569 RepID=UPI00370F7E37
MSDLIPLLATADLSPLADREGVWFATGRGPVFVSRYAPHGNFIRAAVGSGDGQNRAALLHFHPDAYALAPAWLTAIAQAAPAADHRHPSVPTRSVRLLAKMRPDHRLGIPRLSDGSAGWSIPGATARVWPAGRIELRSTTGRVLAGQLEGSQWNQFQVATVADAGLRLLCVPEAQHITRTGQPSGWSRPYDRPAHTGNGRGRKGGQIYDDSTRSSWAALRAGQSTAGRAQLGPSVSS